MKKNTYLYILFTLFESRCTLELLPFGSLEIVIRTYFYQVCEYMINLE